MLKIKRQVQINNVSENCKRYIVARISECELWFWGSWDDLDKAREAAKDIDGIIIERW